MKVSYGSLRKRDAARCAELETQLFEGDDPWPEIAFVRELAASHNGPLGSICCHPRAERNVASIAGVVLVPGEGRMLYCHGLPCQGRFDELYV